MLYPTMAAAKAQIELLLDLAGGDTEAVYRSLVRATTAGRQLTTVTPEAEAANQADYAMLRLALADLTGNPSYRI